jgi:hypothetical protein
MRTIGFATVVMLLAVAGPIGMAAKGRTVKLTIASDARTVEITSGKALDVNVWTESFIPELAPEPPAALPRYLLSFYVEAPRAAVRLAYVVRYVWNPRTHEAFVYLPGRGEEWHRLNIGTILRDGKDGKWLRADPEWGAAVAAGLPWRSLG